ncbi:MAG: Crp/Fnr family transcriptional regulator [Clostridiales bacterium]|nr:Crp/Fnr family transcriptional regulator [Clostridiales bacterium]
MGSVQHLFEGIQEDEYERMMVCFNAKEKEYIPGEFICSYGENDTQVGIVLNGKLQLLRTHADGRQTILEQLEEGDIFGETFTFVSRSISALQVYSMEKSRVLYIDYSHLIKRCSKACAFHSLLVNNALQMISQKAVHLSERLEVLSQRTIREKLQCYFSLLNAQNGSSTFTLPFSYSTLADYLSADRSAMMRELKKMKEDGLIQTDRHKVTLQEGFYK